MGKLYIGSAEPSKFYVGTEEVKKLYLGSDEIWSASNLPDWLPNGIEALLNNITPPSNYYVDIAYQFSSALGGRTHAYFRCFASKNMNVSLQKSSNYYSVFENPYKPDYKGWTVYSFYYAVITTPPAWQLIGTSRNEDRGQTEYAGTAYSHKAVVESTFTVFTNDTRESNWEAYN